MQYKCTLDLFTIGFKFPILDELQGSPPRKVDQAEERYLTFTIIVKVMVKVMLYPFEEL